MRGGHIAAVQELPRLSDKEAVEQCRALFEASNDGFDDFEVWERARKVYQNSIAEKTEARVDEA